MNYILKQKTVILNILQYYCFYSYIFDQIHATFFQICKKNLNGPKHLNGSVICGHL